MASISEGYLELLIQFQTLTKCFKNVLVSTGKDHNICLLMRIALQSAEGQGNLQSGSMLSNNDRQGREIGGDYEGHPLLRKDSMTVVNLQTTQ